jgi:GNAT superfamily N-acetyltransferase
LERPFADAALAARIEAFAALENERFVNAAQRWRPDGDAEARWIAGGCAAFIGPGAPVNQASGLAMEGPVLPAHIDELEAFFMAHGVPAYVNVCPLAHASLAIELSRRHYRLAGFENVLVRPLGHAEEDIAPDPAVDIREIDPVDALMWGRQVVLGFSAPDEPTDAEDAFAEVLARVDGLTRLIAYVDGAPAATAELVIRDDIGWLSADTTLPAYRGRGLQSALQRRRLELSAAAGCGLAVTESRPGSGSQRNMERLGFRIAYTRVDLCREV